MVSDPGRVALHAFYPLISYEILSSKLSKPDGAKNFEKTKKTRPIAYAGHLDSQIYSYYAQRLSREYERFLKENDLERSILAFRPLGMSNIDFAHAAFTEIRSRGSCAAVAMDVSKFFDRLNHELLRSAWSRLLGVAELPDDHYAVFKSVTKFSKVDRDKLYAEFGISKTNPRNNRVRICLPSEFRARVRNKGLVTANKQPFGIPQGTPISAVLSNIYMMGFDIEAKSLVEDLGGVYFRYCDDILVIVPVTKMKSIAGDISRLISERKLRLNTKKTELREFKVNLKGKLSADRPLQYLGFTFDGERVLIRSAAFARYSQKMKKAVRLAKVTRRRWNKIRGLRGQAPRQLYKKSLYKKYSHFGRQNFLRYGYRASEIMMAPEIRGQLKPLWRRLREEMQED